MHVPPMSWRTNTTAAKSAAGTDVSMQIRFYKIESIEANRGHMNLKVWLRYSWHDDRLSWDPADFGGATSTYFLAVGHNKPEETKIWVPDLAVYNLVAGINDELEGQMVVVYSNGQVFWSRPGVIDVLCRFSGLVAFPYDALKCSFEVGGWMLGGNHQRLRFFESGPSVLVRDMPGGIEKTVGTTYNQCALLLAAPPATTHEFGRLRMKHVRI